VLQLHNELEEAARMSGAHWMIVMRRIVVPLLLPALAAVWIWVFTHSVRELSSALLLQGRDNATLPVLLFSYWNQGYPTTTAAVAIWLVLGLVALMAIGQGLQAIATRRSSP
jgi:iron(III) transport system permease protein